MSETQGRHCYNSDQIRNTSDMWEVLLFSSGSLHWQSWEISQLDRELRVYTVNAIRYTEILEGVDCRRNNRKLVFSRYLHYQPSFFSQYISEPSLAYSMWVNWTFWKSLKNETGRYYGNHIKSTMKGIVKQRENKWIIVWFNVRLATKMSLYWGVCFKRAISRTPPQLFPQFSLYTPHEYFKTISSWDASTQP